MKNYKIAVLAGDGIGPEVMAEALKVLDVVGKKHGFGFEYKHADVGGCAIDNHGEALPASTLKACEDSQAILFGSVGGPKWETLPPEKQPERAALLPLRKHFKLFCNLRPAKVFDALVDASTLKREVVQGLDILIVRELTGGVYFGEPRGIETLPDGQRRGINTQVYTTSEIHRVARVAFEMAKRRQNRVCSAEKANVMESGKLWREEVTALHAKEYKDVELSHMYADNCAMQLCRRPSQFDVIVTDNLFGDILSDEAAMLTGSLGMLPSASLGEVKANGKRAALYEPIHGSAPDIAGRGIANPIGQIWAGAMMLDHLGHAEAGRSIVRAIERVLEDPSLRTRDLGGQADTVTCGSAIAEAV